MDVSIIIVNYNTKDLTRNCLASVFAQTKDIAFEVIVSDNASKDGSVEMIRHEFPQVTVIENNANLGFGAANNRGLAVAKGKYIFYLNSDTVLLNNAVKIFFDYWENAENRNGIGALGTMLCDAEGNNVISFGNLPTCKNEMVYLFHCFLSSLYIKRLYLFFSNHKKRYLDYEGEVGYVMGADLFMLNTEHARFDESYFMYYEESDMQFRLQGQGKRSYIIHGPKIIHLEGGSARADASLYDFKKKTSQYYWESCIHYLKKNLNARVTVFFIKFFLVCIYCLPWNFRKTSAAIKKILAL